MLSILRGIDRLIVGLALSVAMVLLALMSCVTFYQIITRFVLSQPSAWSEVAARSLMVWMVYLGLAAVVRTGSLISVDLLINSVSPPLRRVLALLIASVSLAVFGVMVWYGYEMTMRASSQTLAGLTNPITGNAISIGLVYAAVPVGAALAMVAVLARLAEELAGSVAPRPGASPHDI